MRARRGESFTFESAQSGAEAAGEREQCIGWSERSQSGGDSAGGTWQTVSDSRTLESFWTSREVETRAPGPGKIGLNESPVTIRSGEAGNRLRGWKKDRSPRWKGMIVKSCRKGESPVRSRWNSAKLGTDRTFRDDSRILAKG